MANAKISALTELAEGLAIADLIALVDISDTTDAASGTTKKGKAQNALGLSVNAQTGTTYTVLTTDFRKLVTHTNGSSIAVGLPQAGSSFPAGWFYYAQNRGAGVVTITPTTSTIDGASTLVLNQFEGALIVSDGSNYFTMRGKTIVGVGGGAPANATYITQVAESGLSAEQALGALATGLLKNTTSTGVLSIASAGSDYLTPTTDVAIIQVACSDESTALTAGTDKVKFRMPKAMTVTAVRASLSTAQASGAIFTVDINESGTTIISTKITIDNTEKTSTTAVTAPVISDSALADDAEITIDIDQVGDGTAKGLKVSLIGTWA